MAEKEERILVLTTHNKDGECECVMQDGCHVNDSCAICNIGMTRQEAIEKMAVGMCRFDCNDIEKECCNCNEWEKYDKLETLAEAALNAIAPMIPQEEQK